MAKRRQKRLLPAACGVSREPSHPDPRALLREYFARDGAGEFLHRTAWFSAAVDCPHREAESGDTFGVVADVTFDSAIVSDSVAEMTAHARRIGWVTGAGSNHATFDAAPGTLVNTVRARRTPWGWRIASPAPRGMLMYSAMPVREALGVGGYTYVEQLGRNAKRR